VSAHNLQFPLVHNHIHPPLLFKVGFGFVAIDDRLFDKWGNESPINLLWRNHNSKHLHCRIGKVTFK
jgi:hypothetical protein